MQPCPSGGACTLGCYDQIKNPRARPCDPVKTGLQLRDPSLEKWQ